MSAANAKHALTALGVPRLATAERRLIVGSIDHVTDPEGNQLYPCDDCGALRTKPEGGTVFTVCDDCWNKYYPPRESIGAKLLFATREQLIEEVLRLRGELARCQRKAVP